MCTFFKYKLIEYAADEVAEWLRRWTANPLGSARVGSNPIFVDDFFMLGCFHRNGNQEKHYRLSYCSPP